MYIINRVTGVVYSQSLNEWEVGLLSCSGNCHVNLYIFVRAVSIYDRA